MGALSQENGVFVIFHYSKAGARLQSEGVWRLPRKMDIVKLPRETTKNQKTEDFMADDNERFKRSGNPTLKADVFNKAAEAGGQGTMTIEGTVNKAGLLVLMVGASAAYAAWQMLYAGNEQIPGLAIPAVLVALVVGFIVTFVPRTAPYLAPVYAVTEGLGIGVISAIFEAKYPGIVVQAAGLTIMTLAAMLGLYKTGLIRATEGFRKGMMIAFGGLILMMIVEFVMGLMGHPLGFMHDSSPLGIGIAIAITGLAAMTLILDFDMIERGAQSGAPKYMEWYAGFSLMVTLVWLYIRILDLLGRTRRR
jgi:uncharacterized YccA/Bax inhibitor family protein